MQSRDFWSWITSLHGSQTSPVDLCMENGVPTTRINSLYGSQTLSIDLCKQNSVLSTKITSLYCSQTCDSGPKVAVSHAQIQVSMGPRPHLWFCSSKIVCLPLYLLDSVGPSPQQWFCASKTACLVPDLLVCMGPRPHLWICACKHCANLQNY